jgi:uncharacterized protein
VFSRKIHIKFTQNSFKGKVFIITGTRQVGKTTAIEQYLSSLSKKYKVVSFNCDNPSDRENLTGKDLQFLIRLVGDADIIFIDEAQKVTSIGQTLKLLVDHFKDKKQIIATGSSSFNLLNNTQEPLTGRKRVYYLFPLSLEEIYGKSGLINIKRDLDTLLVYGMYPEVVTASSFDEKQKILIELVSSYLYKDIYEFQQLKSPDVLHKLLKALALQVGSEVSYNELGNLLGIDKNTVERYVDLLEKNFVIFRLSPYFTNKRKEISKSKKIYFFDVGVRNALINNFNTLDSRADIGQLWENFIIAERYKFRNNNDIRLQQYFWRDYQSGEIDLVEETPDTTIGFEIKWRKTKAKAPAAWSKKENTQFEVIHQDNFFEWVYFKD